MHMEIFPVTLSIIGWCGYIFFIVFGLSFVGLGIEQPEYNLLTCLLIFPIFVWVGWWFKKLLTGRHGLFFSRDWEITFLSSALSKITGGRSEKFIFQLLFIIIIWVPICYFI